MLEFTGIKKGNQKDFYYFFGRCRNAAFACIAALRVAAAFSAASPRPLRPLRLRSARNSAASGLYAATANAG